MERNRKLEDVVAKCPCLRCKHKFDPCFGIDTIACTAKEDDDWELYFLMNEYIGRALTKEKQEDA